MGALFRSSYGARMPHKGCPTQSGRFASGRFVGSSLGVGSFLAAVALIAASCGAKTASTSSSGSTTTSSKGTTSSTAASSTTTSSPETTVAPPKGGPVPSGFDPISFTAISAQEYWLLGVAPCSTAVCTSIVRTTDGGQHFVGLPAPKSPIAQGSGSVAGTLDTLRFADALDGYAFGTGPAARAFWYTNDGGEHWQEESMGDVLAFSTSGGYAYVVSAGCSNGTCSNVTLKRAPIGTSSWQALSLPTAKIANPLVSMTAHGSSLWISVTTSETQHQELFASSDAGAHFSTLKSPCFPDLGGTIKAASSSALWAVCPTGTLAGAFRSTDGGTTWSSLSGARPLANSAKLAPASSTDAVLAPGGATPLELTTDGGSSFKPVQGPTGSSYWSWIGFTDSSTGSGLMIPQNSGKTDGQPNAELWRTTDGGSTWSGPVKFAG